MKKKEREKKNGDGCWGKGGRVKILGAHRCLTWPSSKRGTRKDDTQGYRDKLLVLEVRYLGSYLVNLQFMGSGKNDDMLLAKDASREIK